MQEIEPNQVFVISDTQNKKEYNITVKQNDKGEVAFDGAPVSWQNAAKRTFKKEEIQEDPKAVLQVLMRMAEATGTVGSVMGTQVQLPSKNEAEL